LRDYLYLLRRRAPIERGQSRLPPQKLFNTYRPWDVVAYSLLPAKAMSNTDVDSCHPSVVIRSQAKPPFFVMKTVSTFPVSASTVLASSGLTTSRTSGDSEIALLPRLCSAPFLMTDDDARLAVKTSKASDDGRIVAKAPVPVNLQKVRE